MLPVPDMSDRLQTRVHWIEQNLLPHEPEIRLWLRRKRVRNADIDDIIQEMYARIGSLDGVEQIRCAKSYAIQVAHSIFVNLTRRPQFITITKDGDLNELHVPSSDASPEDEIAIKDEIQEVIDALAALPPRTREVLLLRRVEGLSQRETAIRLAIAEKTVEKHLARAALALMEQFGRGGRSSGARPANLAARSSTTEALAARK